MSPRRRDEVRQMRELLFGTTFTVPERFAGLPIQHDERITAKCASFRIVSADPARSTGRDVRLTSERRTAKAQPGGRLRA